MQLDYHKVSELLAMESILNTAAEVHGMVCGQLGSGEQPYQPGLTCQLLGEKESPEGVATPVLMELLNRMAMDIGRQFEAGNFTFEPLLPDDDEELALRLHALGRWCDGFNMGFAAGFSKRSREIPPDTREVLADFARIAEIETDSADEGDEGDYMEIVEYIRVATNTVYLQHQTEKVPKEDDGSDSEHPLH